MPDDSMSQNVPENGEVFRWTVARNRAAALLADDELADHEIAARCDVTRRTLTRWKLIPAFASRVAELVREAGDVASRYAIGKKASRLHGLDDRRRRMAQVIEERAADPAMQGVPGGKTGLLCHTTKSIGGGDNAREVDEYAVDTGLLKELREIEKQAAQELGQWTEKREVGGTIRIVAALELTDDELEAIACGSRNGAAPAETGTTDTP
jgi:hypothetical protein